MDESEQPMYTFKLEEKTMPYEFTPDERIEHLLYAIAKLNDLLHSCDSKFEHVYVDTINSLNMGLLSLLMPRDPAPVAPE